MPRTTRARTTYTIALTQPSVVSGAASPSVRHRRAPPHTRTSSTTGRFAAHIDDAPSATSWNGTPCLNLCWPLNRHAAMPDGEVEPRPVGAGDDGSAHAQVSGSAPC
jgi:hypothetical protein